MIKDRINILRDAGIINDETADFVIAVAAGMESDAYDETGMEMFTTHLAMALHRVYAGEPVDILDADIWNDVVENEYYDQAVVMLKNLEQQSPVIVPEEEERFLVMHLCNLLTLKGEE